MKTLTQLFLRGLLFVIPVMATFTFLYWLLETSEQLFRVPLEIILPDGWYVPGMGLLSGLLFILLTGFLLRIYFFSFLFRGFENLLNHLPLVKQIYGSMRDLINFLGDSGKDKLQKVVALDINGMRLIGFVTAENVSPDDNGKARVSNEVDDPGEMIGDAGGEEKMVSVYLPMSYQVGGYLVYVPESRCEVLDMPVNKAMQTVLTANIAGGKEDRE